MQNLNERAEKQKIVKRNIGISLIVFCCVSLLVLITNVFNFYKVFLLGVFGLSIYPILLLLIAFGVVLIINKSLNFDKKMLWLSIATILVFDCIIQVALTSSFPFTGIADYLTECYHSGLTAGGVILGFVVYPFIAWFYEVGAYVVFSIALVVLVAVLIDAVYQKSRIQNLPHNTIQQTSVKHSTNFNNSLDFEKQKELEKLRQQELEAEKRREAEREKEKQREIELQNLNSAKEKLGLIKKQDASEVLYGKDANKDNAYKQLYPEKSIAETSLNPQYLDNSLNRYQDNNTSKPAKIVHDTELYKQEVELTENEKKNIEFIKATTSNNNPHGIISGDNYLAEKENQRATAHIDSDTKKFHNDVITGIKNNNYQTSNPVFANSDPNNTPVDPSIPVNKSEEIASIPVYENKQDNKIQQDQKPVLTADNDFENDDEVKLDNSVVSKIIEENISGQEEVNDEVPFDVDDEPITQEKEEVEVKSFSKTSTIDLGRIPKKEEPKVEDFKEEPKTEFKPYSMNFGNQQEKEEVKEEKPYVKPKKYNVPPLDLLTIESEDLTSLQDAAYEKKDILEKVLESFHIPAKVTDIVVGPAVSRYELSIPFGISVKRVTACADDLAMALESYGDIRIEAPIPGKNAVGIEVPNSKVATIGLREILSSQKFINSKKPLTFALGKDINGEVQVCDLGRMPHLLVAGSTGSGKSVCLNDLIISLIYKSSPEDVRLILIDPKRVEFANYAKIPHLMLPQIINEPEKAINAFNWAINEMEQRYVKFEENRVRDIGEYNQRDDVVNGVVAKMPYIVIICDELADLMSSHKRELEEKIMRIAQKARSAGIHLVLATQRPSVDIITGTIKSNLPSRIAFALTNFNDSKTILSQGGAEKLLGRGDMLYYPQDWPEPKRIQGAYISNQEVIDIVEYVKAHNECRYEDNIENKMLNKNYGQTNTMNLTPGASDEMFPVVLRFIVEQKAASISMIQSNFGLGYPRASKLFNTMVNLKYVAPPDGQSNKPRSVYLTMEDYIKLYGDN